MADVRYTIQVQADKSPFRQQFAASGVTADMATSGMLSVTLALGTATSAVSTANITKLGLCFARSLATSTAHEVSFGRVSGTTLFEVLRLKGGEAALLRLAPGDYAAKGSTANLRLLLNVLED